MTTIAEPTLLTVDQAAAALNVSTQKVRRLITAGDLPVLRIGFGPKAPIRIDPEVLGEVIAAASAAAAKRQRRSRAMRMRIAADE